MRKTAIAEIDADMTGVVPKPEEDQITGLQGFLGNRNTGLDLLRRGSGKLNTVQVFIEAHRES